MLFNHLCGREYFDKSYHFLDSWMTPALSGRSGINSGGETDALRKWSACPEDRKLCEFLHFFRSNSFFAGTDTKRKVDTTPIQIHGTFFYCCGDLFFGLKINHSGYERGSKEISHFFRSRQFYIVFALFNFFFLNIYIFTKWHVLLASYVWSEGKTRNKILYNWHFFWHKLYVGITPTGGTRGGNPKILNGTGVKCQIFLKTFTSSV
jgi:hypothetical protein